MAALNPLHFFICIPGAPNSDYPRDHDASGLREDRQKKNAPDVGMRLEDFANSDEAKESKLTRAEVLVLRLYYLRAVEIYQLVP